MGGAEKTDPERGMCSHPLAPLTSSTLGKRVKVVRLSYPNLLTEGATLPC